MFHYLSPDSKGLAVHILLTLVSISPTESPFLSLPDHFITTSPSISNIGAGDLYLIPPLSIPLIPSPITSTLPDTILYSTSIFNNYIYNLLKVKLIL